MEGICADPDRSDGSFLVCDSHAIHRVSGSSSGLEERLAGDQEAGYVDGIGKAARFHVPHSVCATTHDPDGGSDSVVYCVEHEAGRLRKLNLKSLAVSTVIRGREMNDDYGRSKHQSSTEGTGIDGAAPSVARLNLPEFMCWDRIATAPKQALYIACGGKTIRKFDLRSNHLSTVDLPPMMDKYTRYSLAGLDTTPSGHILFACINTHCVHALDPRTGRVEVVAGEPHKADRTKRVDGPARTGQFNAPMNVCVVEQECSAYVADFSGGAIRKVQLSDTLFHV